MTNKKHSSLLILCVLLIGLIAMGSGSANAVLSSVVNSVSNIDGTLNISPINGSVIA